MQKIIGVTELQRRFRSVFDEVAKEQTPYVLTRGSRPEAALISYDDFLRFLVWQEGKVLAEYDRAVTRLAEQNALYSDEEVAADVKVAVAEVRSSQS